MAAETADTRCQCGCALACLTHGHNCTGAGPCELTPVTVTLTARTAR